MEMWQYNHKGKSDLGDVWVTEKHSYSELLLVESSTQIELEAASIPASLKKLVSNRMLIV